MNGGELTPGMTTDTLDHCNIWRMIQDGARGFICVCACLFKGGSQSLVSVMVGALPGEVVFSLGQVKWVELKSHAVQKCFRSYFRSK